MTERLSPELEARAQGLAARIARSGADILDVARRLVSTTDATLVREEVLGYLRNQVGRMVSWTRTSAQIRAGRRPEGRWR